MKMPSRRRARWIGGLLLLAHLGCAATPYHYGQFRGAASDADPPPSVVIEYGQPNKTLDRIAWVAGAPARIFPLTAKINNHQLSPESAEKLRAYLEKNQLTDVYVYVNHYDPSGQWRRLRKNELVSPLWRYSFGVFSFVGYTVLPSRVFGGDRYNPYTNSLYLNSDVPAVALHEAAFAKDIHARKLPGTYAAINDIPGLGLWRRSLAVSDVLGYARVENDWETERQTYRVLYPRMGAESTAVAAPLVGAWWAGPVLGLGGAAVGHVTGRTLAARRAAEIQDSTSPVEKPTSDVQQASYIEPEPPKPEPAESIPVRLPPP
ncbi:MAG TPA: hypothetical protein VGZ26_03845 [Pirellulales bacterium]|nr:hypothetical protein [Pirellulales bacterium]